MTHPLEKCWKVEQSQKEQALKAFECLETALGHLEQQNYGLAKQWITQAQDHLPWDTGYDVAWPAAENEDATVVDAE